MSRNKYTDNSWSVGNGYSAINQHSSDHGDNWLDGMVCTRYGFVDVYSQGGNCYTNHTSLRFFHDGIIYSRNFKRRMTKRSLAIFARRFAKEIIEAD